MRHNISIGYGTTLTGKPLRTWQCSCGRQGSVLGTSEDAVRKDAEVHVIRNI